MAEVIIDYVKYFLRNEAWPDLIAGVSPIPGPTIELAPFHTISSPKRPWRMAICRLAQEMQLRLGRKRSTAR